MASSILILLDNLRQHTLKSTLYRGKHLLNHTQMSKIQSNRWDKIFNAKKVMSLCPENLNENLVSMMTCIHNIILYSWSLAKLDSRFLSYSSSKGRVGEKSGKDVACVASVSNRVIAWKLEKKKKKGWRGGGGGRGEEETLARKPHDSGKHPLIFHGSVHV